MSNIQIQQCNGSSYTNFVPKESINADTLDGYHSDQFLSPSNINSQYIYPLYTYSFSFNFQSAHTTGEGLLSKIVYTNNCYILTSVSLKGILNSNDINLTCYPILKLSNSYQALDLSSQKFIIGVNNDTNLSLNTFNEINMSNINFIDQLWIDSNIHTTRCYANGSGYALQVTTNVDDWFNYQSGNGANKIIISTSFLLRTSYPISGLFVNETQQYGVAKHLCSAIYQ